ncbi:MAG: amidohydrolase [Candidatus Latescibacterota bacterium]
MNSKLPLNCISFFVLRILHVCTVLVFLIVSFSSVSFGASQKKVDSKSANLLYSQIDRRVGQIQDKVIAWRRDFHQNPELSNREFRTSKIVAENLTSLGLEVKTGVAHTGVIGILRCGKPGPVVALRADIDALPVTEEVDIPFASRARSMYNGAEVGVMHACGHDVHTSVMMGVAEVLVGMKEKLPGTVKFIFQPAEEGTPAGEDGGASLMVKEGVLENPKPDAIFALHVFPESDVGTISYRPGGAMASSNILHITVTGVQTHGAMPWGGVDPVVVSAQIILGLQTIESRQVNVTVAPSIVTIGMIHGGVRSNIIPETVEMTGTVRAFDKDMQKNIFYRITRTAEKIAESAGAKAKVDITEGTPVVYNDPIITARMAPTLERVAGKNNVFVTPPKTGAEDFSFYSEKIPGLFIYLGSRPKGADPKTIAQNHSPRFFVDENCIPLGIRAMSYLAVDYLTGK